MTALELEKERMEKLVKEINLKRKDLLIDQIMVEMCRLHNKVWPMMKNRGMTCKEYDDTFMPDFDYIKSLALHNIKR